MTTNHKNPSPHSDDVGNTIADQKVDDATKSEKGKSQLRHLPVLLISPQNLYQGMQPRSQNQTQHDSMQAILKVAGTRRATKAKATREALQAIYGDRRPKIPRTRKKLSQSARRNPGWGDATFSSFSAKSSL
ncbi:hypothetical protein CDAR_111371 [Caerostris darwini]|uniref:Uncharacterized protein n=1 Tax=Caerostris darwini TaxID=1538125 RepID=A0AAV4UBR6_9ARAC|nr:hypothetical protein CDAR_111371 [Caerostris darwini]